MGAPLKPTISVNLGWNMMGPNEPNPIRANGLQKRGAQMDRDI